MGKMMLTFLAATAILVLAVSVRANGNSPENTNSLASVALPAVDMSLTLFADGNGDGINDYLPHWRRIEIEALDRERAASRGQLLNQSMAGLTKAQKNEIKQLRTRMRQQGAAPDQIHTAVGEKVRSYGVAVPVYWGLTSNEYLVHRSLTNAQRAEVQALADSWRQQGKTPAQIRSAVAGKYQIMGRHVAPGKSKAAKTQGNQQQHGRGNNGNHGNR